MFDTSKKFFTRRNLLTLLAITFGAYLILVSSLVGWAKYSHNQQIDRARRAREAYWNGLTPEQQAIKKAEIYLGTAAQVKQTHKLFLDYLQRAYGLDDSLGLTGQPFETSRNPKIYPQEINYLERIAFPDRIVKELPKNQPEGPALTNVFSANCDHLPLPGNFWQTMEQNDVGGGYNLTHNALAFRFMKDNQCAIPADKQALLTRSIMGMTRLAGDTNTNKDLRYEAVAFLELSGQHDKVQQEWIKQIIAEQNEDGSWDNPANKNDTDHTTILALWALAAYAKPDGNKTPLIRH